MIQDIKPIVTWSDDWVTGIKIIDDDHRHLVDLIQKLFHSMMTEKGTTFIRTIFVELINYTNTHFNREERMFKKYGFDELDRHKILHEQLVEQVLAKGKHILNKGRQKDLSFELLDFFKDWLENHIIKEDLKFKTFLIKNNIQV
ncbi:MAG: hemerythrin family protein [Candidatus Marinimicrobia bacterium]|nr:hemerythrin family protein [Candidatus Neomarinimicrobiota bacterium]